MEIGISAIYAMNFSAQSFMTRTKRETAEMYLEPCQTSKMKLFAKILNCIYPQTIVFIVLTSFYKCVFRTSLTSKMELFVKIIINFKPFTIFTKSSILDIRLGFEYASGQSPVKTT